MPSTLFAKNAICKLLDIEIPVLAGGMVWCSGWRLAHAISTHGGLGVIGAGSMAPEVLDEHITQLKAQGNMVYGVNLPLIYARAQECFEVIMRHRVPVFISSAGSPAKYTAQAKAAGMRVGHLVANAKFAQKAIDAGVDGLLQSLGKRGGARARVSALVEHLAVEEVAALWQDTTSSQGGGGCAL